MKQRWKLDELAEWLSQQATPEIPSPTQRYRHQSLKENFELRPQILDRLKAIVWRAHEDARLYRQGKSADFCIPGKPSAVPDNPVEWQPELLPLKTQKEYFGEIVAALVVENFAPFGVANWVVPAFFFRFHDTAYHRLEQMHNTDEKARDIPGLLGNDGLAFQLDPDGHVRRSLVYEAKCTSAHRSDMIAKAHKQLSDLRQIPESIWQAVEILRDRKHADDMYNALRAFGTQGAGRSYERCDLIAYVHGQLPDLKPTWIDPDKPRSEYAGNRRLEAVEVYIKGVCESPDRNLLDELVQEVHREIQTCDEIEYTEAQETAEITDQVKDLIERLLEERAESFPPRYAKLYSQHKRLRAGQQGLASWRPNEASDRLSEAVQLLESAYIAREVNKDNWQKGMQRAGAILEWLAHPELNPSNLPLQLLSAASYQLAGYPACALGLLKQEPIGKSESRILRALLEADFPELLRRLTEYWATKVSPTDYALTKSPEADLENFEEWVIGETTQALGVLCAEMRWGDEERLSPALDRLFRVSKMMLHGRDVYSWLLSKLCAEVVTVYAQSSFRNHLPSLASELNYFGEKALENYLRLCYKRKKSLAWPSQVRGIERLKLENSFALCTPTGSGKTTVAEVAILQSLFKKQIIDEGVWIPPKTPAPLAIYLTPTRALSAEVESTLSHALGNLGSKNVVVTGLYGGTDWGPTDVWLTETNPTVLICTYEKAEALMRFLGSWFRDRISLVIIDEAHKVNFDQDWSKLQKAENRTLRLESIGTRILTYLDKTESRIMALSAVASGMDDALAQWVSNDVVATPERAFYRSTRQLIGRLECLQGGEFKILYDLLDGDDLEFEKEADGKPFVPNPLPAFPSTTSDWSGPQKQFRPYLFWAAMHLAKQDESGQRHAVLISVTQKIGGYAKDFLTLLESDWAGVEKPDFFVPPDVSLPEYDVWQDCLKACKDYFTDQSREYRLLQHGVVVHHGKMPGPLARLLVKVIEAKIVHLVLATSTLSEGVNLPFETLLIPSLRRYDEGKKRLVRLSPQEFSNLVGRAGRPGSGTEGQSLVLVGFWDDTQKDDYSSLLGEVLSKRELSETGFAQSPLAELIAHIEQLWHEISGSTDDKEFQHWLETTAPLQEKVESEEQTDLTETLDTLDSVLLSVIVELEQIAHEELSADEMEERLRQIWQHSYARYASQEESRLEAVFIRRGRALKEQIYTDATQRRRLYRTTLPPCSGDQLLRLYPTVIEHLKTGEDYLNKTDPERFDYIRKTVELLNTLPKFELEPTPKKYNWEDILGWWLRMWFGRRSIQPSVAQISKWHQYVSQNFGYRFNWGLGSVISLAAEEAFGDLAPTIKDWPRTGLPWAAFWMKELITWGTLNPVAAYLLARHLEVTRDDAEERAREYYDQQPDWHDPDEMLNAMSIQRWAADLPHRDRASSIPNPPTIIRVEQLLRDFSETLQDTWKVVPVETEEYIYWFDIAGVPLARSTKGERWLREYLDTHDFSLNVARNEVSWEPYTHSLSPF